MNDLAEFLLTRYAEDEEDLCQCCDYGPATIVGFARADLRAKRQIVESSRWVCDTKLVPAGLPGVYDRVSVYAVNEDREEVLLLLALPYADHPDYREEWKP